MRALHWFWRRWRTPTAEQVLREHFYRNRPRASEHEPWRAHDKKDDEPKPRPAPAPWPGLSNWTTGQHRKLP